jgi:hypothetical protein
MTTTTWNHDGARTDQAFEPAMPDHTLGDLLSRASGEAALLVRKEVELARVETKRELRDAGVAAGNFAGAAVAGFIAALLLCFAAAWGLAEVMPVGFAFLIVGVLVGIVAAVLAMQGRQKMRDVEPLPETVETLQEDIEWIRAQSD